MYHLKVYVQFLAASHTLRLRLSDAKLLPVWLCGKPLPPLPPPAPLLLLLLLLLLPPLPPQWVVEKFLHYFYIVQLTLGYCVALNRSGPYSVWLVTKDWMLVNDDIVRLTKTDSTQRRVAAATTSASRKIHRNDVCTLTLVLRTCEWNTPMTYLQTVETYELA